MAQMTKQLEAAIDRVSMLAPEQQDALAAELTERADSLLAPPMRLSLEERAELESALDAARRGELASEADVAAFRAKHGL